jgi:hypothetical protein
MRHGKLVAATLLALATTAGAAGALPSPGARAEARPDSKLELAAPSFASAFERLWGFLIAVWDETRGTIVPGDGGAGGAGEGASAALIPDGE